MLKITIPALLGFLVAFFVARQREAARIAFLAEMVEIKIRSGATAFSQLTAEELAAIKTRDGAATIRDRTGATIADTPPPPPPNTRTGATTATTSTNVRDGAQ